MKKQKADKKMRNFGQEHMEVSTLVWLWPPAFWALPALPQPSKIPSPSLLLPNIPPAPNCRLVAPAAQHRLCFLSSLLYCLYSFLHSRHFLVPQKVQWPPCFVTMKQEEWHVTCD